jgi:hypothetical protein
MFWSRRHPLALFFALGIYLGLALTTVNNVGVVGEVGASWALENPPEVVVDWVENQPVWADGHRAGPLVASQVRPLERLHLGPWSLPLAVNQYTGGPPDWPARWVYSITGSLGAVTALHVLLGALLLVLVHRFLRFHGTDIAAAVAALTLATDWNFLFYRKVLGGTEILLQAALLLTVWAFWSRRWAGGKHGGEAIAWGMGLGLLAKATFVPTLAAFGIVALLTRSDRPATQAPARIRFGRCAGILTLLTAPLWVSWLHHGLGVPPDPHVISHDYLGFQMERAWSGLFSDGQAREAPATLWWFLSSPLPWFRAAYQSTVAGGFPWRSLAWIIPVAGSLLAWRDTQTSRPRALLRFMSLFVPLQLLLLWVANKDLHHLAQAAVPTAIWIGLATDRLAAKISPPRSPKRAFLSLWLCMPFLIGGTQALRTTDTALATTPIHSFTQQGQQSMKDLVQNAGVTQLWASDYDLSGLLEVHLPQVQVRHIWGELSTRKRSRPESLQRLLQAATGAHYLVTRPSAPMIYNLRPSAIQLQTAADALKLELVEVGFLQDEQGKWAQLFSIEKRERQ